MDIYERIKLSDLSDSDVEKIQNYLINPVDQRIASLDKVTSLDDIKTEKIPDGINNKLNTMRLWVGTKIKKTWNQGIDTIKLKHREVNKQNAEWHSDPLDTLSYPTHRS